MSEIENRAQAAVDEMEKTDEAWENGAMTVQGYADGMRAKIAEVESAAREVARAGMTATKEETQQQSPSKKYRDIAQMDMAGYIDEMSRSRSKVREAMRSLDSVAALGHIRRARGTIGGAA
jgi:methyl-accepting chemotaxis protein